MFERLIVQEDVNRNLVPFQLERVSVAVSSTFGHDKDEEHRVVDEEQTSIFPKSAQESDESHNEQNTANA